MGSKLGIALYVISMVALIVALDVLALKDQFWERLVVNIGIVLVYGAVYFLFLRRS